MQVYWQQDVQARIVPTEGEYLYVSQRLDEDGVCRISVGLGETWTPLDCKEVYAKAIKACVDLRATSCAVDLTAAAKLGADGMYAALEGLYGGAYEKKFSLTGQSEPNIALYADGDGWTPSQLENAACLAQYVMKTRNLVNCPSNRMRPAMFADALKEMAARLPVEVQLYPREDLQTLGLEALLSVGDSSAYPPILAVLRYTGAEDNPQRVGFVGKGVTVDSGGYCLKASASMEGIKGDMAGGAAAAAAVCALAAVGARVNVTAVVPICENRISSGSLLPGDVIGSLSGKTIEVFNSDAEGRLILADGLCWAARREHCTHLVDIATLTGAVWAMLGYVATGVMASDDDWYGKLAAAARRSGERFWRMPTFPEYQKLIESDYADVRNTSKDGCGAITAGLFLEHFTDGLPWMHLDIAGTADNKGIVWQHQVPGATGTPVNTLFHLALQMEA